MHPAAAVSRFRPALVLAAWYVALCLVLRIVLWAAFGREAGVAVGQLGWILPAGALADAIESLYLLLPFALLAWLAPDRWYGKSVARRLLLGGAWVFIFATGFLAVAEYFFFEEFTARFNLVSVDYLLYPTEVIGDIRSEYPVVPIVLAMALLAAAATLALRRLLIAENAAATGLGTRSRPFAVYGLAFLGAMAAFETSAVAHSVDRIANELAANGLSSFVRALRTSEIDYHAYYASRPRADNLRQLARQLGTDGTTLDRAVPANPGGLGKLNVVVLVCESFAAEFSALHGGDRDWTPEFDRLAAHGLRFSSMYASGTRTVRGLEAIATSLPPIPTVSILHRPGSEHVANWGGVMQENGYHTSFLYGGYGDFDDMNRFFAGNGFEVLDRTDIDGPARFENIWGVSDEDLYDLTLAHLDEVAGSGTPFFTIVMNTSNHKPYTFREGVPGVLAKGGGRESGVRYEDFAIGYFMREAARHAWFHDTLFVIVADHGARLYGRAEIPVASYRIPLLLYSPKHIEPGVVDGLTTQIDIAPTVLGLLGLPYAAPFFGQDALRAPEEGRVAPFSHNHDVALLRDGRLAILGLHKSVREATYDPATGANGPAPVRPDPEFEALAVAYFQTAYELFRAGEYQLPGPAGSRLAAAAVPPGD
ncbi:MAG: LTA synthase family protein [Steroidobacteraceae bacterium]|jgi:phosphoglycerol transferase MdoB-like AlkP superfamily enzyme|nr:LTA synthase family protein [Steroidobacteraceae bacterium]